MSRKIGSKKRKFGSKMILYLLQKDGEVDR